MRYHLAAFVTVCIWGSTFVFTKMLLVAGLSPAQIFTLRFLVAYVLMLAWSVARRAPMAAGSLGDEMLMLMLGVTGGSLYFMTENAALQYTTATNTSLIVCSCPLFAMLLVALCYRRTERVTAIQAAGSVTAFAGMAIVVLNGRFVLHLSPRGDALAFGSCMCWAVYSLLMKMLSGRYSSLLITRKVFFYGLLTIVPYYAWRPHELLSLSDGGVVFSGEVVACLLFLGVVASMLCYLVWGWVIRHLGAVTATNWVYFNPITTIVFASYLLGERITPWFLLGAALIIAGMFLCDHHP